MSIFFRQIYDEMKVWLSGHFVQTKRFFRSLSTAKPRLVKKKSIKKELASQAFDGGDLYLFATNTSGNWPLLSVDLLLALALVAIGKEVIFVLCDEALPACQMCEISEISISNLAQKGPGKGLCNSCFGHSHKLLNQLGIRYIKLSKYKDVNLSLNTIDPRSSEAVLHHAKAGFLRYLGKGDLSACSPVEMSVLGRFERSAAQTYFAYEAILKDLKPAAVIAHHGIYTPQGSVLQACKDAGVDIACWTLSYRKQTILLSWGNTYHRELPLEAAKDVFDFDFDKIKQNKIKNYLSSREIGSNDWISFSKRSNASGNLTLSDLGLKADLPTALLLTNVMWDAALHFEKSIFPSMIDWIVSTIEIFRINPKIQLIIRVHPAENLGSVKSRQKVIEELRRRKVDIPGNVVLVSPEDKLHDTYWLIEKCDSAVVFGTKAAIEIAARGKKVLVAGDSWCRGKGFTLDPTSIEEYRQMLLDDHFFERLSKQKTDLANKYAYYLFFRRMITIQNLVPRKFFAPVVLNKEIESIAELARDPGLDFIANSIASKKKFEFDG